MFPFLQLHWQPTRRGHHLLASWSVELRCWQKGQETRNGTPHTSSFHTPLLAPLSNQKRIGPGAWAFNGQRATSARTNSTPGHVEGQYCAVLKFLCYQSKKCNGRGITKIESERRNVSFAFDRNNRSDHRMHVSFIPRHRKKSHGSSILSSWQVLQRDCLYLGSAKRGTSSSCTPPLAWPGCHTMNHHDLHAVKQPIL